MTSDTTPIVKRARELLKAECEARYCAFLKHRETGELEPLGQAALAAIEVALSLQPPPGEHADGEREKIIRMLRRDAVEIEKTNTEAGGHAADAFRDVADAIEAGAHLTDVGDGGD